MVKNDEERGRISTESFTKAPWLGFSSRKHIFSPKTAEMHSQGVMNIFKQPPPPIYREIGRCLPPRGFFRKISKCTPITKFTPLFVFYGKVTTALRMCFRFDFHLFFSSLSPTLSEICLPKVFRNFTEATETIFQQRGVACRPIASSLSNPTSKMFRKGL